MFTLQKLFTPSKQSLIPFFQFRSFAAAAVKAKNNANKNKPTTGAKKNILNSSSKASSSKKKSSGGQDRSAVFKSVLFPDILSPEEHEKRLENERKQLLLNNVDNTGNTDDGQVERPSTPRLQPPSIEQQTIQKVWSMIQMKKYQDRCTWERQFMDSKLEALEKLRAVDEGLFLAAVKPDYTQPPLQRGLPVVQLKQ